MSKFELYSDFRKTGTNIDDFFETLQELDNCTKATVVNSSELYYVAVVNDPDADSSEMSLSTPASTAYYHDFLKKILEEDKIPVVKFRKPTPSQDSTPKDDSYTIGFVRSERFLNETHWNEKLLDELVNKTKFGICMDGDMYSVSPLALLTILGRAKVAGEAFVSPCFSRVQNIAQQLINIRPEKVTLITREYDKEKAVFAMHSKNYQYIPQYTLKDIYDILSDKMGTIKCLSWEVNHQFTRCYIEFPDIGREFADAYNLPDEVVPGLYFFTSDTGNASLTVNGIWRIGNHLIGSETVRQVHKGSSSVVSRIIDTAEKEIFVNYKKVPERLCELLMIDVPNPTLVIDSIFKQINIKAANIGAKRESELIAALKSELVPMYKYTAYDIATMIASVPDRCINVGEDIKKKLREFCVKALFADYSVIPASYKPIVLGS